MTRPFIEIDHSGDVGIEARGGDVGELLANLTRGLFGLLCRGRVEPVVERGLRIEAATKEDLVVDWLNEIIAIVGARGELFGSVTIATAAEDRAEGVIAGEPIDSGRHDPRFDVKAATYHGLTVTNDAGEWCARVIFDL